MTALSVFSKADFGYTCECNFCPSPKSEVPAEISNYSRNYDLIVTFVKVDVETQIIVYTKLIRAEMFIQFAIMLTYYR